MAKRPYPSELLDNFSVRMPAGLRDEIKATAKANNRSANAEIVARLSEAQATLRDQIAISAVAAILTTHRQVFEAGFVSWDQYASEAYKLADAMLAARSKDRSEP